MEARTAPRSILVVDDDAFIARLLEIELTAAGHEVRTAGSGAEALQVARERPPDLVLADVMMPGMDGFELTRLLRLEPQAARAKVILLTALGFAADRSRGLEAGADDYVVKPFETLDLLARVETLLGRREAAPLVRA